MDQRFFRWDAATGKPLASGRAEPDGIISRVEGHRAVVRVGQKQVVFERLAEPARINPEPPAKVDFNRLPDYTVAVAPTADGRLVLSLTDDMQKENRKLTITVTQTNQVKARSQVRVPWSVNVPRHP